MGFALVSTVKHLLCVDLVKKQVKIVENNRCEYYGISWFAAEPDLVLTHSGVDHSTLVDITTYAQSELGWISAGSRTSKPFLSAPHQILCTPDKRIICTNTGRNVVQVIDLNHPTLYQEVGMSSARWDRLSLEETVGDHLNSVFLKSNCLYVIAHGFDKGSRLGLFTWPDLELIEIKNLGCKTGLHNIWVTDDGQQIACHSNLNGLVDLESDTMLWCAGSQGYSRGLAASKEYVVIGESMNSIRDYRHSSSSGLWIVERDTWKPLDYICLGPFGAVHEVRLLDVPDEAHHGHIFTGMKNLLGQDVFENVSERKMADALSMFMSQNLRIDYIPVFGQPVLQSDGWLSDCNGGLCFYTRKKDNAVKEVSFGYCLNPSASHSHVSGVIDYKGQGDDTDMTVVLLQPSEDNKAHLSVWQHDGNDWKLHSTYGVNDLPVSGLFQLKYDNHLHVLIDKKEVLHLKLSDFGVDIKTAKPGVRWIGAAVKFHEGALFESSGSGCHG